MINRDQWCARVNVALPMSLTTTLLMRHNHAPSPALGYVTRRWCCGCTSRDRIAEQQRHQGGAGGGMAGTVAEEGSHVSSARAAQGTCRPRRGGGGGVASLPADAPPGYPRKCNVPQGPWAPLRHDRQHGGPAAAAIRLLHNGQPRPLPVRRSVPGATRWPRRSTYDSSPGPVLAASQTRLARTTPRRTHPAG
jgi:hypothetical protein